MKRPRVRLSTLLLLVVVAALAVALVAERRRSAALLAENQSLRTDPFHLWRATQGQYVWSLTAPPPAPSPPAP